MVKLKGQTAAPAHYHLSCDDKADQACYLGYLQFIVNGAYANGEWVVHCEMHSVVMGSG